MRHLLVSSILVVACASWLVADDDPPDAAWKKPFVKRLDFGIDGDFVDDEHPPVLELFSVLWNFESFKSSGFYNNLTSAAVEVRGRVFEEKYTRSLDFYPFATLQVANGKTGDWKTVGRSPNRQEGQEMTFQMAPNSLELRLQHPDYRPDNRSCHIDISAFRPLIGTYKYGKVILDSGGESQILLLTDLLPRREEATAHNE